MLNCFGMQGEKEKHILMTLGFYFDKILFLQATYTFTIQLNMVFSIVFLGKNSKCYMIKIDEA